MLHVCSLRFKTAKLLGTYKILQKLKINLNPNQLFS